MEDKLRLQKWLSQLGLYSRREAEAMIQEGRIQINGKVATLGEQVNPETDQVHVDNVLIEPKPSSRVYWLFHKPKNVLVSRQSQNDMACIYDLPAFKKLSFLVHPVGRLDFKTEGLLLITNDGELSNRLCHPSYKLPRKYSVLINGKLSKEQEALIRKGLMLKDGKVKCNLTYVNSVSLGKSTGSWYFITVYEGRNRLVRRVFEHLEFKVLRLVRIAFGNITLSGKLGPGKYRQLTSSEIQYLKKSVGLTSESSKPAAVKKQEDEQEAEG